MVSLQQLLVRVGTLETVSEVDVLDDLGKQMTACPDSKDRKRLGGILISESGPCTYFRLLQSTALSVADGR